MSHISAYSLAAEGVRRELCDRCLGRLAAKVGTGLSNQQRGAALRMLASNPTDEGDVEDPYKPLLELLTSPPPAHDEEDACSLCEGLFMELDNLAGIVEEKMKEWEYSTFLLGCRPDPDIAEAEELLWSEIGADMQEPIKSEINREVGRRVSSSTGKEVDFKNPDVVAVVDLLYHHVDLEVNPCFFYGRYKKLERGIPQTRWPCRNCKGSGCSHCGGTGKMYQTSVEEIICRPIMEALGGEEHHFHGMGREDIDARMLGGGRPFVAQVDKPHRRETNLSALEDEINAGASGKVEITGLRTSSKREVREIKAATPSKTYKVGLEFESDMPAEELQEILNLEMPLELQQRTPNRVSHRRSDLVRDKQIISLELKKTGDRTVDVIIKASSGTYIKEFCHGDEERTKPSIAGIVGIPCRVLYLDVLEINCLEE